MPMQVTHISEEQKAQCLRDGYLVARQLLPEAIVTETREALLAGLAIDCQDSTTWQGKNISPNPSIIALTEPCRTEAVESIAEQLIGSSFLREWCQSPYLESQGVSPSTIRGYIPVLNFPTPGLPQFQKPTSYHIDGMHMTRLWPENFYLVVFAYLTDVVEYGGSTTVLPGSHRQVFEHWFKEGHPGSTHPPKLDYADPIPLPGRAGDVIFMHYLTVHSGSANHSEQIRVGLNTAVMPDPAVPYQRKSSSPQTDWTPLDYTLRTDNLR